MKGQCAFYWEGLYLAENRGWQHPAHELQSCPWSHWIWTVELEVFTCVPDVAEQQGAMSEYGGLHQCPCHCCFFLLFQLWSDVGWVFSAVHQRRGWGVFDYTCARQLDVVPMPPPLFSCSLAATKVQLPVYRVPAICRLSLLLPLLLPCYPSSCNVGAASSQWGAVLGWATSCCACTVSGPWGCGKAGRSISVGTVCRCLVLVQLPMGWNLWYNCSQEAGSWEKWQSYGCSSYLLDSRPGTEKILHCWCTAEATQTILDQSWVLLAYAL